MDPKPVTHAEVIAGFKGENTVLSDLVLPPTVSPDARNIDYRDGTIRKRKGFARVSPHAFLPGSLLCDDATGMSHTKISAYNFAGAWRIDFLLKVLELPAAESNILDATNGATGFKVAITSAGELKFYIRDGGGTLVTLTGATGDVVLNGFHWIGVYYDPAQVGDEAGYELLRSGLGTGGDATCTGHAISTRATWNWYANPTGTWLVDEIRIWDGYGMTPPENIQTTTAGINPTTTGLVGYYKFDTVASAGADSDSNGNTGTVAARSYDLSGAYVYASYNPLVTGIHPVDVSGVYSKVLITSPQFISLYDAPTDTATYLRSLNSSSNNRWTHDALNGVTVLVNDGQDNFRYDPTNGLAVLSPSDWSNGSMTIGTTAGTAPDGGAGTYSYIFRWRNSNTGDEGAISSPKTQASGAASILISSIPVSTELGVNTVRIYRTTVGGGTYYFLKDLANGTTTYTDDGTDILSSTLYDERYGKAPAAACVANFNNMILLGDGSTVYASEIGSTGRHYAFNTVTLGNGDGGKISACIAVSGVCVFFKTNGIYAVNGYSPTGLSSQKLFAGQGAVHASAVCASDEAVYYLTQTGICRLPLPAGQGAPEEITVQSHRSLFESFTDANRKQCSMEFDMRNRRLYASFVSGTEPVTLCYNEKTGAWSRQELPADSLRYFAMNGAVPSMYMGWRGYFCKLDTGDSDGVQVGSSTYSTSGTTTSSGSSKVNDSTASFPITGGGLAGCTLTLVSGSTYTDYTIRSNTATQLSITPAVSVASGAVYKIGRIDAYWTSPKLLLNGKGDGKIALHRMNVWQRVQSVAKNLTVSSEYDGDGATKSEDIQTNAALTTTYLPNSGHRLSVKFRNRNPDEPFEVEGFQFLAREGSTR